MDWAVMKHIILDCLGDPLVRFSFALAAVTWTYLLIQMHRGRF